MEKYNHNHSQEKLELGYDNLDQLGKLQIDYTFLRQDYEKVISGAAKKINFLIAMTDMDESDENDTIGKVYVNNILRKAKEILNTDIK